MKLRVVFRLNSTTLCRVFLHTYDVQGLLLRLGYAVCGACVDSTPFIVVSPCCPTFLNTLVVFIVVWARTAPLSRFVSLCVALIAQAWAQLQT